MGAEGGIGAAAFFVVAGVLPTFRRPKAPVPEAPRRGGQSSPCFEAGETETRAAGTNAFPITAGATVWGGGAQPEREVAGCRHRGPNHRIWNALTGEKQRDSASHAAGVTAVSFSGDEQSLASGGAGPYGQNLGPSSE